MTITRYIVILFSFTCFIAGCTKDHAPPTEDDCYNFEFSNSGFGPFYSESVYQFKAPCFNPNNSNEFCYLFINNETESYTLCKFDLSTLVKTTILSGYHIILQPKWSADDWIYFNILGRTVWKVKANGDSVTKVTQSGADLYPEPNYDGSKITFAHIYEGATHEPSIQYIVNEQAQVIDSLNYSDFNLNWGIVIAWSANDQWALPAGDGVSSYGIGVLDLSLKSVQLLNSWTVNSSRDEIQDVEWSYNSEDIYYTKWGIYKTNINDKKEVQIKQGCDSKRYQYISVASDNAKILTQRTNSYLVNQNTAWEGVIQNSKIYLMNIDGSDEHQIELPNQ